MPYDPLADPLNLPSYAPPIVSSPEPVGMERWEDEPQMEQVQLTPPVAFAPTLSIASVMQSYQKPSDESESTESTSGASGGGTGGSGGYSASQSYSGGGFSGGGGTTVGNSNNNMVSTASGWIGTPYLLGGNGKRGIDCSALTQTTAKQNGASIPRTAGEQWRFFQSKKWTVPAEQAMPGDFVYLHSNASPSGYHTGVYMGDGKFINAPRSGALVRVDSLEGRNVAGFGRLPQSKTTEPEPSKDATPLVVTTYHPGYGSAKMEGGMSAAFGGKFTHNPQSPTGYTTTWNGKQYDYAMAISQNHSLLKPGDVVNIAGHDWIAVDHFGGDATPNAVDLLIDPNRREAILGGVASLGTAPNGISSAQQMVLPGYIGGMPKAPALPTKATQPLVEAENGGAALSLKVKPSPVQKQPVSIPLLQTTLPKDITAAQFDTLTPEGKAYAAGYGYDHARERNRWSDIPHQLGEAAQQVAGVLGPLFSGRSEWVNGAPKAPRPLHKVRPVASSVPQVSLQLNGQAVAAPRPTQEQYDKGVALWDTANNQKSVLPYLFSSDAQVEMGKTLSWLNQPQPQQGLHQVQPVAGNTFNYQMPTNFSAADIRPSQETPAPDNPINSLDGEMQKALVLANTAMKSQGLGEFGVTSGRRTTDEQNKLIASGNPNVVNPADSSHVQTPFAADIDFKNKAQQDWFYRNAPRFGLVLPSYRSEPWHVELMPLMRRGTPADPKWRNEKRDARDYHESNAHRAPAVGSSGYQQQVRDYRSGERNYTPPKKKVPQPPHFTGTQPGYGGRSDR